MSVGLIPAGVNIDANHDGVAEYANASAAELRARWRSGDGPGVLAEWEARGFDRAYLEGTLGRFHAKIDLRGVDLRGKNLSRIDLSDCDFYAARLARCNLVQAKLDFSFFSEADLRGADLSWSSARDAFFDNAEYDQHTKLLGVPLHSVNFNLAALLYDQARTEQRIAHLRRRSPVFALFLEWTCDYGRSLTRWALWTAAAISSFAASFYVYRGDFSGIDGFVDALYFSIVTFTTLGYGDILPLTPLAKTLAVLDVVTGYVMGGLLISIFARRILGD